MLQNKKEWAKKTVDLLKEMNKKVHESPNNALSKEKTNEYRQTLEKLDKEED